MDTTACGIPDVSYHGENAWQVPEHVSSRQLGVLYYDGAGTDICFAAYNMHWLNHDFALPALPGGKKWYEVMRTGEAAERKEKLLEDQRMAEVEARSVLFLVGR